MRSLIIILSIVAFSINTRAQTAVLHDTSYSFLKNLKFKNGRDTITVKAVLHSIIEASPRLVIRKHPNPSIYKYKFDSEIEFQLENCSKRFSFPLLNAAYDKHFLNEANLGITIYLTCVVFNEYSNIVGIGLPDLIVIHVAPKPKSSISVPTKCHFLPSLHFKNGVDTILLKVSCQFIFKSGAGLILDALDKDKFLKAKDYQYAIGFEAGNCAEKVICPYHFNNAMDYNLLNKQPEGTTIYLTCIVFEKYFSYGLPFFVINKYSIGKP